MAEIVDAQEEPQEITYKELLTELEGDFIDDSFAPDQRSIITSESVFQLNEDEIDVLKDLEYARLSDIYDQKRTKFFGNMTPNDIQQG